ncbi:helix-turn-helix domain-containing protein [Allofournierella sp.]|uniref:helix-turn-helix domain-containing protein n=1 Tax=Allofournierella sp. TaxID=1940256 RepID=UPI003AB33368
MDSIKDILEEITRLRLARHWSEYELAQHSGISQSTISTWYRKRQAPTIKSLEKICNGFGLTLSQFFTEGEEPLPLTSKQRELLDNWASLTPEQQSLFLALFKSI